MRQTVSSRPIAAVLFDFDGTLADTSQCITHTLMRVVREFGVTGCTRETLTATIGRPLLDVAEEICPGREGEFVERYRALHIEDHTALARLYPGTEEALKRLRAMGLSLGIVTSKSRKMLDLGLDQFGLTGYFGATVCVEDVERHKPDPAPVLKASELLGVDPSEAVMVGDTGLDIVAGQRAGALTAAATWGVGKRDELIAHQPDLVLESICDLVSAIGLSRGIRLGNG